MTAPPSSGSPGARAALDARAVTLWLADASSCAPERWRSYRVDDYQSEYRALPAAEFAALLAERDAAVALLREEREHGFVAGLLYARDAIEAIWKNLSSRCGATPNEFQRGYLHGLDRSQRACLADTHDAAVAMKECGARAALAPRASEPAAGGA
jgi:hypothetical protein